jgi:L-asparaginase II
MHATGKQLMTNPIIAEVIRGLIVESRHTGAFAVSDSHGRIILSAGDITMPIYPRSAIKAFQCLPVIESGAADHFGFNNEEIALCCSSHNGEPEHVRVARSILAKAGLTEACYECGAHWPSYRSAAFDLVRHGEKPRDVHNNCSGKHAGMLALAKHLGLNEKNYVKQEHAVQRAMAESIGRMCDVDNSKAATAIDGCSVPTWAMPLKNMALGFARLTDLPAGQRIIESARENPFLIAGTDRFDTKVMETLPRLFLKVGAEGVYCGCIPHAGLGFALKCDDGAVRAAEVATASLLVKLDVWTPAEIELLKLFTHETMSNWRKIIVGEIRANL